MSWKDVFNSQNIYPNDYDECRNIAHSINYKFLAFNGLVYSISDSDMKYPVCRDDELK